MIPADELLGSDDDQSKPATPLHEPDQANAPSGDGVRLDSVVQAIADVRERCVVCADERPRPRPPQPSAYDSCE